MLTERDKMNLRQGAIRIRMSEIAGLESTEELRAETQILGNEYGVNESRIQALIIAGDVEPVETRSEDREFAALVSGANLGELLLGVLEHRQADGATWELQRERGLGPNQIPLDLLRDAVEIRAAGVTPIPGNHEASQRMILQPIYATGDSAFLGIRQDTVPAGDSVYPILSNMPTVGGPHTDSTDVPETAGTWTADVLNPGRIQCSNVWRRTDASRFPGMQEALRESLNMALTEKMDAQMLAQLVTDVGRTAVTDEDSFASYRKRLVYDRMDGRFASSESDIRMLVGAGTLAHMSGEYRANNSDDSAVDSLRRISGGVKLSAHIAAVAASKQDVIIRRGMRDDAVIALWDGPIAIFDEISRSGAGEIELTVVQQLAWKVTRAAGFARIHTQHA